jgi:hypothetical protein
MISFILRPKHVLSENYRQGIMSHALISNEWGDGRIDSYLFP